MPLRELPSLFIGRCTRTECNQNRLIPSYLRAVAGKISQLSSAKPSIAGSPGVEIARRRVPGKCWSHPRGVSHATGKMGRVWSRASVRRGEFGDPHRGGGFRCVSAPVGDAFWAPKGKSWRLWRGKGGGRRGGERPGKAHECEPESGRAGKRRNRANGARRGVRERSRKRPNREEG
jgi:hypothetical protein